MCRSSSEPGGPRRCPSHGRTKLRESLVEVGALVEREAGIARLVGSAKGIVHDGDRVVDWTGHADLYEVDPPLNGHRIVVASTVDHVPSVRSRGTEWNIETFLYGVSGADLQANWDELPGSAWGADVREAFGNAGYRLDSEAQGQLTQE